MHGSTAPPDTQEAKAKRKREQGPAASSTRRPAKRKPGSTEDTQLASTSAVNEAETNMSGPASPSESSDLSDSSSDPSSLSPSDEDEPSEVEESSDEDEDADAHSTADRGEEVINVLGRPKPSMRSHSSATVPPILQRLRSFLPELQAANEALSKADPAGQVMELVNDESGEAGEEGEQYIEMNLGLGVLEEKKQSADIEERASTATVDGDDTDAKPEPSATHETDILGELLGRSKGTKPGIQEIVNS